MAWVVSHSLWSVREERGGNPIENPGQTFSGTNGPWGELVYTRVNIEMPDHFVTINQLMPKPTAWWFPGQSRDEVLSLFKSAGLPNEEVLRMVEAARWEMSTNGVKLTPPPKFILALPASSRAHIYAVLARHPDARTPLAALQAFGGFEIAMMVGSILQAALERKYSANPGEGFFTGGGLHYFGNFSKDDDFKIMTVREALRRSTNLVFVRLMRDVAKYYMFQTPGSSASLLADADGQVHPAAIAFEEHVLVADFDPASRKTQAAAALLTQTQAQMKTLQLPPVDETLAALATAAAGR